MSKSKAGFYLLLIGVLMLVTVRGYVHYKGGFSPQQDWLSWWQDIGALAGAIGFAILFKKVQA
jgi:hypothetical protein